MCCCKSNIVSLSNSPLNPLSILLISFLSFIFPSKTFLINISHSPSITSSYIPPYSFCLGIFTALLPSAYCCLSLFRSEPPSAFVILPVLAPKGLAISCSSLFAKTNSLILSSISSCTLSVENPIFLAIVFISFSKNLSTASGYLLKYLAFVSIVLL